MTGLRGDVVCSGVIIGAALRVHKELGPGLLESAYETFLASELRALGRTVVVQRAIPVMYHGVRVDVGFRPDLLVDERVVVELKAVAKLLPIHEAQLLSYLKLGGYRTGLLINFHATRLRDGIRRMLHDP